MTHEQPPGRGMNAGGLFLSAFLAPGLAVIIALISTIMGELLNGEGVAQLSSLVSGTLLALLIATLWGVIPSLMFGGAVLALVSVLVKPLSTPVLVVFAVGAAGLYVVTGLGVHALSPGAGLLLAPWATLIAERATPDSQWIILSIVASGAPAGAIYAMIWRRG